MFKLSTVETAQIVEYRKVSPTGAGGQGGLGDSDGPLDGIGASVSEIDADGRLDESAAADGVSSCAGSRPPS
jgi:hypothetical protein